MATTTLKSNSLPREFLFDGSRTLIEEELPSCSAVEALERQEPFIYQTLASSALVMLAHLFRYGKLNHHGGFFNEGGSALCL
jgi:hypothetical protein